MTKQELEETLDKIEHSITNYQNHIKELRDAIRQEETKLVQAQLDRQKVIKALNAKTPPPKDIDQRKLEIERLREKLPELLKKV